MPCFAVLIALMAPRFLIVVLWLLPWRVGDGVARTINNADGASTKAVQTYVGAEPGDANLRRFASGSSRRQTTT